MKRFRAVFALLIAAAVFAGGYAAGQAKNQFSAPTSIIHVSLIKWNADAPDAEKKKALEGVKEMAAAIPGITNVWIHASRMQPRDYHAAFAIEFADQAAADRYAKDPAHDAWAQHFLSIRETSISPQITNCPAAGCP